MAGKLVNATSDIANYITLPRLNALDIDHNTIYSLEGIEELAELSSLSAYHNILGTIENIDWSKLISIKYLDLGYNQLKVITPLEVLTNLEYLNLSDNLLSGSFDFYLANMNNLQYANFNSNQYRDIAYFINQFTFLAKQENMTIEDYIAKYASFVTFQYQMLDSSVTVIKSGDSVVLNTPKIFSQAEQIDPVRTSFGITSKFGTVYGDGSKVVLPTNDVGKYVGKLTIEAENGYGYVDAPPEQEEQADYPYVVDRWGVGIAYGTTWTVEYTVIEDTTANPEEPNEPANPDDSENTDTPANPENPDNSENPDTPVNPENPDDSEDTNTPANPEEPTNPENPVVQPEYGYEVTMNSDNKTGYVYVETPEITLDTFIKTLLSSNEYNVQVSQNDVSNIATGSVVTVETKDGVQIAYLEVIVKGDVNGDGEVDARDSGIVRNVINDVDKLLGVYELAADVNNDKEIDSLDALLILQYRADKISSFKN